MKFFDTLTKTGFEKTYGDITLFTHLSNGKFRVVLVYVDDIITVSNNDGSLEDFKTELQSYFKLRDLGDLHYFLGFEIARTSKRISMNQRKYALELLSDLGFLGCKPSTIPMELKLKLAQDERELLPAAAEYRRLIGKLIYMLTTRPDLCYAVTKLCQFSSQPRVPHLQAVHKVPISFLGLQKDILRFPHHILKPSTNPYLLLLKN